MLCEDVTCLYAIMQCFVVTKWKLNSMHNESDSRPTKFV
jgi:hypothetical protein